MHNGDFKVGFSLVSLLYDISMSELKNLDFSVAIFSTFCMKTSLFSFFLNSSSVADDAIASLNIILSVCLVTKTAATS